jgi:hypothetical protein
MTPPAGNVLWLKVSGKLSREEYADLVPKWEQVIAQCGSMRLLFQLEPGFSGWQPLAAFDDLKFSLAHRDDIERVAVVGEKRWHESAKLWSLLVNSEVRYFEQFQLDEAQEWLRE